MTREEAIKLLDCARDILPNKAIDMAIEALRREEAEEKGYCHRIKPKEYLSADAEWIPCSERLPEDGTTVITFDSTGDIEFGSYENGKWYWLAEACADYWTRNSGVLAWMPLPEPYKGGDDE